MPLAGFFGFVATLVFYLALLVVQNENADYACESPQAVPGLDVNNLRDIHFENSFLNFGGRCAYYMDDGSVIVTREPGWWFPATIVGFLVMLAGPAAMFARRKGRSGVLYGITTLVAPPMGLALSLAVAHRPRSGAAS